MRHFFHAGPRLVAALSTALLLSACFTVPVSPPTSTSSTTPPPPVVTPPVTIPLPPDAAASVPIVVATPRPPRVGLALGGGAARGFAHIGVIQVLEENGIKVDCVAGTSAGSLVAALYASGRNGKALAAMADTMDESAFADWAFPGRGLIRGEALGKYVRDNTGHRSIEQMAVSLGIVATDLDNGAPILFQRGDPGVAVRASSAVPAVFTPVRIGAREYVDGGLVSPVPVRFARQMGAELVIAVDISAIPDGAATGDPMRMLLQTFAIMGRSINHFELREADVVMRPKLAGVSSADFSSRKKSIQAGREVAIALLPELRAKIAAKTK